MYITNCLLALVAVNSALAHTVLTNLLVDGINQGDAVCIRMPDAGPKTTAPVTDIDSKDMACGLNGERGVARVCKVRQSAKLTFLFKMWPDGREEGSIDPSHRGSCAVYMKHVSNVTSVAGDGSGWFKIWDEGHDDNSNQWCTDKLIKNKGLLSIRLPKDLLGGEYLVRAEILALHNADKTPAEPQFYNGCAQIFLDSSATALPKETVSIPGYITHDHPGISFNVWENQPKFPYPIPGPKRFRSGKDDVLILKQDISKVEVPGQITDDAVIMNGNWWSKEFSSYDNADDCWNKCGKECWAATDICYKLHVPTGYKNCKVLEERCRAINEDCKGANPRGPSEAGKVLTLPFQVFENIPPAANEADVSEEQAEFVDIGQTKVQTEPQMKTVYVTQTVVPTSVAAKTTLATRSLPANVSSGSTKSSTVEELGQKYRHTTDTSSHAPRNLTHNHKSSVRSVEPAVLTPDQLATREDVGVEHPPYARSTAADDTTAESTSASEQHTKKSVHLRHQKTRRWRISGHLRRMGASLIKD